MDGKEAIINRILSEGETKAKAIILEAKSLASKQKAEAENWASNYIEVQTKLANDEASENVKRRLTVADLDVRKEILKAKQEVVSEVFDKIYFSFCSIDKQEYLCVVEKLLVKNADEGDRIVLSSDGVLNENDVKALKIFTEKNLSIDTTRGNFIGGLMLIGKVSDKDLTFKAIVDSKKDDFIGSIAQRLFKD
ncbi:MAG: hypothetical protein IKA99_00780 [Clostridia bacterium]|nr:hypothetical protein [Clostridia bacterium]